jgi:ribosomal protein L37AE/L43A
MMRCSQCSTELVAPERSEYWNDRRACHIWLCSKCNMCFESLVSFPAEPMRDVAIRPIISPSLLPPLPISSSLVV